MARYKVVGNHAVAGVKPGKTVDIDDDAQAAQLVYSGHIEPVKASPKKKDAGKVVDIEGGDI